MTTIQGVPHAGLVQQFNDLTADLSRTDAKLEQLEHSGRYPTSGWDTTMGNFADRLLAARDDFMRAMPGEYDISGRLGEAVKLTSENAGKLYTYQTNQLQFGANWGSTLDNSIRATRDAASLLLNATPPGGGQNPPVPGGPIGGPISDAVAGAIELVDRSLGMIQALPVDDRGSDATKQARIEAFQLNKQAQELLEPHFNAGDDATVSQLRTADASLEDAAWQLAKKPSPDGRFNGVDIPGAIRDTETALETLRGMTTA